LEGYRTESSEPISVRHVASAHVASAHVASGGRLHEGCCRDCDDFKTNEIPVLIFLAILEMFYYTSDIRWGAEHYEYNRNS
jgi:hypothetical protein